MSEFRLVIFFFLALGGFFLVRSLDPLLTLRLVVVLLILIAVGMTLLNLIQAWRRDPRFLSGFSLGGIQLGIGASLWFLFNRYQIDGFFMAQSIGPIYLAGAIIVFGLAGLRSLLLITRPVASDKSWKSEL